MVLSEKDVQELKEKCNSKCVKEYYPPHPILDLIDTIEQLRADLRGKNNEIADLKARIEYLQKFQPRIDEWNCKG